MDAVLSLKASSSHGRRRRALRDRLSRIEGHLRAATVGAAVVAASELPAAEQRAERALTAFLGG